SPQSRRRASAHVVGSVAGASMSHRVFHHRAGEPHAYAPHPHHDWVAEHAAQRHPDDDDICAADLPPPRQKPARAARPAPQDFTLGHGAWQVRIGPVAFWICVGSLVIMAGWAGITATYFAFHDDVLARLIARQAAMQFAYEDRIAEMRAQVDRVTSRQL